MSIMESHFSIIRPTSVYVLVKLYSIIVNIQSPDGDTSPYNLTFHILSRFFDKTVAEVLLRIYSRAQNIFSFVDALQCKCN